MTALVPPDARLRPSWQATVDEFGSEPIHGCGFWDLDDAARQTLDEAGFESLIAGLVAAADPATVLPEDWVHCTYFWITAAPAPEPATDEVIGFLALRHRLNDFLFEQGGHIGYSVRPSRRREGHATRALALGVRHAAELGLDRVLVTCDDDNLASARTIERNGGVHEDTRQGRRRYWIETDQTSGR